LRSIFVSIATQTDKHVLKNHARKQVEVSFEGACGHIASYSLANLKAHPGALPVNELT
jgi:hypothetical protein